MITIDLFNNVSARADKMKPCLEKWCKENNRTDLLKEWDLEKNYPLTPSKISFGSAKKVYWKCTQHGHSFITEVRNRTERRSCCPFCSGRQILEGFNDIVTLYPTIIKEWNYEKNNVDPRTLGKGSHYRASWICSSCQKEYESTVYSRVNNHACPYCSGRKMTVGKNDLQTRFPNLTQEWDYEKNAPLTPRDISYGNAKKVFWICPQGHSYIKSINARTNKGYGCPYCSGMELLSGFNDLATMHPEYLPEWDHEKNQISPTEIIYNSTRQIHWVCPNGHQYSSSPSDRNRYKIACPQCMRELQTSFPEQALFYYIKRSFHDAENGNKEALDGRELDIYIPSKQAAVEYDGIYWHSGERRKENDLEKTALCLARGITLYRIRETHSQVEDIRPQGNTYWYKVRDFRAFEEIIRDLLVELGVKDITVDLDKDAISIQEQYVFLIKEHSIASEFPEVAQDWDYKKNGRITPEMIVSGSNAVYHWKCKKCGHEWATTVSSRASGTGCPVCAEKQRRLTLAHIHANNNPAPEDLRSEYDDSNEIPYEQLSSGSAKEVWWICPKGHKYQSSVYRRVSRKSGCPYCSGRNAISGVNDLSTLYPEMAKEWDYVKNIETPEKTLPHSNKKCFWICPKGHSYEASPTQRVSKNTGCPICSGQKVLAGFNDFATAYPALLEYWDYSKNDISPSAIGKGSVTKVYWKCPECGEETYLSVDKFTRRKYACRSCNAINFYNQKVDEQY